MRTHKLIVGVVTSGRGMATEHLSGASDALKDVLGATPMIGSLNVVLSAPVLLAWGARTLSINGRRYFWRVDVNGIACLAYRFDRCPLHLLELVSEHHLRKLLKVSDGDTVSVRIPLEAVEKMHLRNYIAWHLGWKWREHWYYRSDVYRRIMKKMPFIRRLSVQNDKVKSRIV